MGVIKQGGSNPFAGKMTTTTGMKDFSRRCMQCGRIREDDLFTINANGKAICSECASPKDRRVLRADCEDGVCNCENAEPEDGRLEDAELLD